MRFLRSLLISSMFLAFNPTRSSEVKTNLSSKYQIQIPLISELFSLKREDISVSIPEMINLYTDCDIKNYEGKKPTLRKTRQNIIDAVKRRQSLENLWTRYFNQKLSESQTSIRNIDTTSQWNFLISSKTNFDNGFEYARIRENRWVESHDAIDIFAKEGSEIKSPTSGLVVSSSNNWNGSFSRRSGFQYREGGLGKLSGNGVIVFNPQDTSYYFMAHLKEVYVKIGDVISHGDPIGTVGKTGNAIYPNVPSHLHFAYKKLGRACGIENVLVPKNPYWLLNKAQNQKNK